MTRWERWNRVLMDQEDESQGSEGSGSDGEDGDNPDTSQEGEGLKITPTDTNKDSFEGTEFEGMSVGEVAAKVQLLTNTVRDQGRELNVRHREEPTPPPVKEEEPEFTAADFFAEPQKYMKRMQDQTREEMKADMQQIIAPFQDDLAQGTVERAWASAASKFSDFSEYREMIESQLDRSKIDKPTEATITELYYKIKGYIAVHGKPDESRGNEGDGDRDGNEGRRAPPQHRASNQPIRKQGRKTELRELTENEETMRREGGFTHEEVLKWQNADDEDVAEMKDAK